MKSRSFPVNWLAAAFAAFVAVGAAVGAVATVTWEVDIVVALLVSGAAGAVAAEVGGTAHGVDVAERRNVVVDLQVSGTWPDPPDEIRRALTDGLLLVVSTAAARVRITLVGADGDLTLGAVGDDVDLPADGWPPIKDVLVDVISEGRLTWVQARWRMP